MQEQEKKRNAKEVYNGFCRMLDSKGYRYEKDDENMSINTSFRGDDLSMPLIVRINADAQLITVLSQMPFMIKREKLGEAAIALCAVNDRIVDGSFDFKLEDGRILFRLAHAFDGSVLGAEAFEYMLICSVSTIDEYNDKLLALNEGKMSLDAFIKFVNE